MSFLGLAASACVLAGCSGRLALPDRGDSNLPGADANADSAVPGTDANADSRVWGANANVDSKIKGAAADVGLPPIACGSNASASGNIRWDDSSHSVGSIIGAATATLRSEGGITRLELAGHYHAGTVVGTTWAVTATLTGGETLLAGTYACGQGALAGYSITGNPAWCWASTPTADCPGQVAACTFTLAEQIWPGCFKANAKGSFSMTLTGTDAGTVPMITNGTFDVPIFEPVPPS